MATTLEQLQAQRDALAAAIASGATAVRDQFGRYVEYRSLDEMRSVLAGLDAQIGIVDGSAVTTVSRRYRYVTSTCRGL